MILYTKRCLACVDSRRWRQLKRFAHKNNLELEVRRTDRMPEWNEEAKKYEIEQPFIVHNRQALSLSEPLERIEL